MSEIKILWCGKNYALINGNPFTTKEEIENEIKRLEGAQCRASK